MRRVAPVLAFLLLFATQSLADDCHNVGDQQVIYDPDCAQGGDGCNAGGQGQMCRFCTAVPDKCKSTTPVTTVPTTSWNGICQPVDGHETYFDPSCSLCDAGDQDQSCKFCGSEYGTTCPEPTTTTPKATTTKTTRTTTPHTTYSTTPYVKKVCSTTPAPTTTSGPKTTTAPPRCKGPNALTQDGCSFDEASKCNCNDGFYCCLDGPSSTPTPGCNPVKWTEPACTCACLKGGAGPTGSPSGNYPNCTWEQYKYSWCDPTIEPYYCPSYTFASSTSIQPCGKAPFLCPDLCYITHPNIPKPDRTDCYDEFIPSNDMIDVDLECGAQTFVEPEKCDIQPNDPKWIFKGSRDGECLGTYAWCAKGDNFVPSKYQCGPSIMNTPICPLRTQLINQECPLTPEYTTPSWAPQPLTGSPYCDTSGDCLKIHTPDHCIGCCQANPWPWSPQTACQPFWSANPKGGACRKVSPKFNWIITTCDSAGGLLYSGACHQNPFSQVDVRYVAAYQLDKDADGEFIWKLSKGDSVNWNGETQYVDFSSLPTEATGTGPIQSCSGGGGGWNAAYFPYKSAGMAPPAFMFVLSYDHFDNAAWFMLNQRILDSGPAEWTCKDTTNCWGEISAGEIDFLETPNLFPDRYYDDHSPAPYRTEKGWKIYRLTSYNAANRCFACNHGFSNNGSLNQPGCGGLAGERQPTTTFYDSNDETEETKAHVWVAVLDARGTTVYKDPEWPGITKDCAAETLVNLHPKKPEMEQPCTDPTKTCGMFLPSCVTNISDEMLQITRGDVSRIPYCYRIDHVLHTTCSQNWWDLMMDTGQWAIRDPDYYKTDSAN